MSNAIWDRLESYAADADYSSQDEAENLLVGVREVVKQASSILDDGARHTPQFTLHDAEHSERVLDNMAQIIPRETLDILEPLECAILILSAYLHDIGMSAPEAEVRPLRNLLTDEQASDPASEDEGEFRDHLAERWGVRQLPLQYDGAEPVADRVEDIIADWVRCNHDTGGWGIVEAHKWCFEYKDVPYASQLRTVCESHGLPAATLREPDFSTIARGRSKQQSETCNLRYLAMILRIADIWEFDIRRAPKVLYRHRDIRNLRSVTEWEKHFPIVAHAVTDDNLKLTARPEEAVFMATLLEMVKQVNRELVECRSVYEDPQCKACFAEGAKDYLWKLPTTVRDDIQSPPDTYEYIDGGFKVNEEQILELLGGHALYGERPWVGLRELLQNAFDAVRMRQALHELARRDVGVVPRGSPPAQDDRVTVEIVERDNRISIVCTDTGVGMSKADIEDHLLQTANSSTTGSEVIRLKRLCKANGVDFERTSQFGIGVLSYFMLADGVSLRTKPDPLRGFSEDGWVFTTEGVGAFGELRPEQRGVSGTEVELRLRPDIVGDYDSKGIYYLVLHQVREAFDHVPCQLQIHGANGEERDFAAGWLKSKDEMKQEVLRQLTDFIGTQDRNLPVELQEPGELEQAALVGAEAAQLMSDAESTLHIYMQEYDADGLRVRVCIPYFDLEDGPCLALVKPKRTSGEYCLLDLKGNTVAWLPECKTRTSFYGARISSNFRTSAIRWHRPFISIDVHTDKFGTVTADRRGFVARHEITQSLGKWTNEYSKTAYTSWAKGMTDTNPWRALDGAATDGLVPIPKHPEPWWWHTYSEGETRWRRVNWSAITRDDLELRGHGDGSLEFRDHKVAVLDKVPAITGKGTTASITLTGEAGVWPQLVAGYHAVGRFDDGEDYAAWLPTTVWAQTEAPQNLYGNRQVPFPPEWSQVVKGNWWLLNISNPIVRILADASVDYGYLALRFPNAAPSQEVFQQPLQPTELASWIVLKSGSQEFATAYERTCERKGTWLQRAWDAMRESAGADIERAVLFGGYGDSLLVTPTSIESVSYGDPRWSDLFPMPAEDWQLIETQPNGDGAEEE